MNDEPLLLFSGPANPPLAVAVAEALGRTCARAEFRRFPDGEVSVRLDVPVRGRHVAIVQPTCPPVNDRLLELLAFADACRRESAARVTAVIPYFGYARSDRRQGLRTPVMGRLVADLLEASGVGHVITVDVHAPQVDGFFRLPVDHLSAITPLGEALRARVSEGAVVVAPDLGAAKLAAAYGRQLGLPTAVVHKVRRSATEVEHAGITGTVEGRRCIIVDDMITTGGTIVGAVRALRAAGATGEIVVAATHGVFTSSALLRLAREGVEVVYVTDTVPLPAVAEAPVQVVSVAPLLAEALGPVPVPVPVPDQGLVTGRSRHLVGSG